MKKLTAIILFLTLLLSVVSCGGEDFGFSIDEDTENGYHELGLYFKLPKEFTKKNVPYAEVYYSNSDGASFMFNVYNGAAIEELGYDGDISVEDYTKKFIILNGLDMIYDYSEETGKSVIEYNYSYPDYGDGTALPDEYTVHLIMRGTSHLYVITMVSETAKYESDYKAIFEELVSIIYAE